MKITRVGVDIAKSVFHVHAVYRRGRKVWQAKLRRAKWLDILCEKQDTQAMHRVRSELICQRTAKANQIRGVVGEYGLVAPVGIARLRRALPCWLEDADNGLTHRFRVLLWGLYEDLQQLDNRVDDVDDQIAESVKGCPVAKRLLELHRVGALTASALSVALGDGKSFGNGRDLQPHWD